MRVKVMRYNPAPLDYHDVIDTLGNKRRVDMMVDGAFPPGIKAEDIVGKTYEVGFLSPYIEIANDVNPNPITDQP